MKLRNCPLAWLALIMAHLVCATAVSAAQDQPGQAAQNWHPARLLVQARPGADAGALARFHEQAGAKVLTQFPAHAGLELVALPAGQTVPAMINRYERSGLVEYAEPDYARELALMPNDPRFLDGTLWGLNNTGQSGGKPGADIAAVAGWDIQNTASNIVVAVLDTGIRPTHEDLAANIWTNPVDGGYGWNALSNSFTPLDDEGHGTLVSGVLGAVGNNGTGCVGVAWSVQIMAGKCFNSQRIGYDSDIIACIDFARSHGARIVNASLGGDAFSLSLSNAIYSLRTNGILLVAAAGNSGRNIDTTPYYPACYDLDNVVSVAYSTRTDTLGTYSNFGATNVDLAAPGDQMYSTFFTADNAYLGGVYLYGTSFAAPYVSGALALLLARFPAEPYPQILARLYNGVDPLPSLAGKCLTGGRLNLRKALSPPLILKVLSATPGAVSLRVTCGPNRTCVLQASPDLIHWSPIYTNSTTTNFSFDFSEIAGPLPPRFYRATAAP